MIIVCTNAPKNRTQIDQNVHRGKRSTNDSSMLYAVASLENEVKYFKYNISWGNFSVVCYKRKSFSLRSYESEMQKMWIEMN